MATKGFIIFYFLLSFAASCKRKSPTKKASLAFLGDDQRSIVRSSGPLSFYCKGGGSYFVKVVVKKWMVDHEGEPFFEGGDCPPTVKAVWNFLRDNNFSIITYLSNLRSNFVKTINSSIGLLAGIEDLVLLNDGHNPVLYSFMNTLGVAPNRSTTLFVYLTLKNAFGKSVNVKEVYLKKYRTDEFVREEMSRRIVKFMDSLDDEELKGDALDEAQKLKRDIEAALSSLGNPKEEESVDVNIADSDLSGEVMSVDDLLAKKIE
eukprot:TRINITY_DN552_c0_g1_i6.p1 TRINITY_DN552_c0_g1~~TRINITY_DN552_c0_g1_i6.p1  ORF type:complete len:262 (+),score=64.18 TRINITY_DN552_c0_g1_i6:1436-2221(+)